MRLEGLVRFRDQPPDLGDATVRVLLLDTSQADAPAETIVQQTMHGTSLKRGSVRDGVRFALDAPELRPGRSYSLVAHVDVSGSGKIEVGDHLTMESVPVESDSAYAAIEIPVLRVRS